jgi:hypothetical protein
MSDAARGLQQAICIIHGKLATTRPAQSAAITVFSSRSRSHGALVSIEGAAISDRCSKGQVRVRAFKFDRFGAMFARPAQSVVFSLGGSRMCQACGFADIVHGSKMRRRAFVFGAATAGALTVVGSARAQGRKSQSKQTQQTSAPPKPENVMTPDEALARLMEGNKRYQKGIAKRHDFVAENARRSVGGQNPYADSQLRGFADRAGIRV